MIAPIRWEPLQHSTDDPRIEWWLERVRIDASQGGTWLVRQTTHLRDGKGNLINVDVALTTVNDPNEMWR